MPPNDDPEPDLAAALRRWSLTNPLPVADTATSRVFKVERPSGAPAALKIVKPYGADEMRGVPLMQWYGGVGAVRVLDNHDTTILMEWLDGAPLGDSVRAGDDDAATDILCEVVARLHQRRVASFPDGLMSLADRFAPLLDADPAIFPPAHREQVARAAQIAQGLLDTSGEPIPLHGDFHHDNVVGSARGWLAIDAKGVIGDAAYDVSNVFLNPVGAGALAGRPERIDRLATAFATRLGFDRGRVLGWAAAHAALSACWHREDGTPMDWSMKMLPLLLAAFDAA